MPYPIKAAVLN